MKERRYEDTPLLTNIKLSWVGWGLVSMHTCCKEDSRDLKIPLLVYG